MDRAAPMTAAPFVWREDGRPDWRSMWTSFCDLALHGGPPHRGPEQALRAPRADGAGAASDPAMVAEIRRGIWETTGLYSELAEPGWIAITCEGPAMAEWLATAVLRENVEARAEGDRLLLPAGPGFGLEDEVKSIVTVVAKTHHYGAMHGGIAKPPDRPDTRMGRFGFRCAFCGLGVDVSRPGGAVDCNATCPADGARMVREDLAPGRRSGSVWHAHGPGEPYHSHDEHRPAAESVAGAPGPLRVGVGGTGDGKTALIDALRRRYGRRRAIATSPAAAIEVSDPAVDLVLVEADEASHASRFGPMMVDATIGVLDASGLSDALGLPGDRGLETWHLLVVSTAGESTLERSRLEEDTRRRRGEKAMVFVGLATAEGVDAIASWLERELLFEPRRARSNSVGRSARPGGAPA